MATTATIHLPDGYSPWEHHIPGQSDLLAWLDAQKINAGDLAPDSVLSGTGKTATITRYVRDDDGEPVPDGDAPLRFKTETVDVPVTAGLPKLPAGVGWDKPNDGVPDTEEN